MSIGVILIIQTLTTCLMTGLISKSFWFSYILFLVFIGGMLILFIYISSLASNEKINFSIYPLIKFIFIIYVTLVILYFRDKFYLINWFINREISPITHHLINENYLSISKIYNEPNNYLIILLISYLLLTLIIVVKITNLFVGPLRPNNY